MYVVALQFSDTEGNLKVKPKQSSWALKKRKNMVKTAVL